MAADSGSRWGNDNGVLTLISIVEGFLLMKNELLNDRELNYIPIGINRRCRALLSIR